ncbi:MAG: sulfite exporter TauE/SafE family protein, partial [Burkholderiales bacterium]|nr:sulfite exporter TauE/SafE family protein [Burkholderiales bacterium]
MWLIAYALIGAVIGFLAGLLGIGGGMSLVPVLAALFTAQGLAADHTVHLALATAMASVVFTSSSSVLAHHRLGTVDWSIVRRMAPGMVVGSLLSALAAGWLPQRVLALGFALIVYGGATQILLGRKPAPGRQLPGQLAMTLLGLVIGVICGLVSAGGAFLTVPLMMAWGVAVHRAI